MSIFVPGFGLTRAGNARRAITWLIAFEVALIFAVAASAARLFPAGIGFLALLPVCVVYVGALVDSCRPGRMSKRLRNRYFAFLCAIPVLLALPFLLTTRQYKIPTGAMEPTLMGIRDGSTPDHVLASWLSYAIHKPQRGDLIVFRTSNISGIATPPNARKQNYVKRIVGLPGERIEIKDGSVYADSVRLGEADGIPPFEYVTLRESAYLRSTARKDGDAFVVLADEYFCLGDNSANSADSRVWGTAPKKNIIGRVIWIYYPFSRWQAPK